MSVQETRERCDVIVQQLKLKYGMVQARRKTRERASKSRLGRSLQGYGRFPLFFCSLARFLWPKSASGATRLNSFLSSLSLSLSLFLSPLVSLYTRCRCNQQVSSSLPSLLLLATGQLDIHFIPPHAIISDTHNKIVGTGKT